MVLVSPQTRCCACLCGFREQDPDVRTESLRELNPGQTTEQEFRTDPSSLCSTGIVYKKDQESKGS